MRKATFWLSVVILVAAQSVTAAPKGNGGNTMGLCHLLGNGEVHLLEVNVHAVAQLLEHGDYLPLSYWEDLDGDGLGAGDLPIESCLPLEGYADNPYDCDDTDAGLNWWDMDGDGYSTCDGDCDDFDETTFPGAEELCGDDLDNDCDGEVDEDCSGGAGGQCAEPTEVTVCSVDMSFGTISCDNGTPLSLVPGTFSVARGVFKLDMSEWSVAFIEVATSASTGWLLNLGNSPTNNGFSGDGGQFSNDSEMELRGTSVTVYRSDRGGSTQALSIPQAIESGLGAATIQVCDGFFGWESAIASESVSDPHIFQIDGDEPDPEAYVNDRILWLGVDRTVGNSSRTGWCVYELTITFGR